MHRITALTVLFLFVTALVAACSGAAAPAAAPAAESNAAAAEMPQPDPADAAQEATAAPAEQAAAGDAAPASASDNAGAAAVRTFQLVPEQSSMQYFVEEEFFGQAVPFVTAIGATNELQGEVTLQFSENSVAIEEGAFTADISTLTSDRPRRDQAIRDRWLESSRYPTATFIATEVANLPADAALGEAVSFQVQGDMTIRDVTNPITWEMTAQVNNSTLSGVGTTFFYMQDYGFDPPDIAGILRVTDGVTVTVNFVAEELP